MYIRNTNKLFQKIQQSREIGIGIEEVDGLRPSPHMTKTPTCCPSPNPIRGPNCPSAVPFCVDSWRSDHHRTDFWAVKNQTEC